MTVDSKTLGPILDYRAAKTVKSYAANAYPAFSTFVSSFMFLPDDLRGQPTSSACQ